MARLNRREFLDDAFFATALAAIGGPALLASPADAAPRRRVGANDRMRIAVIGVRGRGMAHVEGYLGLKDTEVAAICDIDLNVTSKAVAAIKAKTGKDPEILQDLRKVFERKDIDAVSMALPIHWHTLASVWAMESGKHVYVEKPVSHNVREGRRIHEASLRYGKVGQTGTQSRSAKAVRDGIAFVHGGGIGKVKMARALCYKPRNSIGIQPDAPVPAGVDFDLWLGPAPKRAFNPNTFHYNWHWMWDTGAGDLGNQGIHQMDIARWGLGIDTLCKGVMSYGARLGYEDAGETANTQVVVLDYGPKTLVFEVRGLETKPYRGAGVGVIFEGTDGYVAIPSYSSATAFDKDGKKVAEFKGDGDHFANFLKAVRSRKSSDLAADIQEGHLSSALCHLGNISYRLGEELAVSDAKGKIAGYKSSDNNSETLERTLAHLEDNKVDLSKSKIRVGAVLPFDPVSETFPDNATANEHLSREYRAPFVVPAKGKV